MAGIRVEVLLVALIGSLLLVSAGNWEPINETQLLNFYQTGQWVKPQSVTSPDDSRDYDNDNDDDDNDEEELVPEDADSEFEGAATSDFFDPFSDHGFQVNTDDSGPSNWASATDDEFQVEHVDAPPRSWTSATDGGFQVEYVDAPPRSWTSATDGGFQVEFVDAPPTSWSSSTDSGYHMEFIDAPSSRWTSSTRSSSPSSPDLDVVCSDVGFQITLPNGPLSEVKVLGSKELLSVMTAPVSCGYKVDSFRNRLTVPFTGCNVKLIGNCKANGYGLQLLYVDEFGQTQVATASCEAKGRISNSGLFPRSGGQPKSKCTDPNPPTTPSKPQNCDVTAGEQVTCGQSGISSADCEKMGCCVDSSTSACYYPLDECTEDQHFVFAIRDNSASIPVDTTKLVIPADTKCKPVIVNDKVAIFKFKLTECGARFYEVGGTKIYLAEVQTIVQALKLKYGIITRSDPLRFMVECRYGKTSKSGAAKQSLASIGYMVKTPPSILPSDVIKDGLYGVQLRIAKDKTYSSYLPTDNQPLRSLLGKPVYLELRLKSPKPNAVILVNYCIAYPRSAKNALVLVYEGCANPYDPNVSILQVSDLPKNRHQRRFVVKAFQFMEQKTNKYLDEEIYFMCSSEVCRPAEKTCEERCFDGKAP